MHDSGFGLQSRHTARGGHRRSPGTKVRRWAKLRVHGRRMRAHAPRRTLAFAQRADLLVSVARTLDAGRAGEWEGLLAGALGQPVHAKAEQMRLVDPVTRLRVRQPPCAIPSVDGGRRIVAVGQQLALVVDGHAVRVWDMYHFFAAILSGPCGARLPVGFATAVGQPVATRRRQLIGDAARGDEVGATLDGGDVAEEEGAVGEHGVAGLHVEGTTLSGVAAADRRAAEPQRRRRARDEEAAAPLPSQGCGGRY